MKRLLNELKEINLDTVIVNNDGTLTIQYNMYENDLFTIKNPLNLEDRYNLKNKVYLYKNGKGYCISEDFQYFRKNINDYEEIEFEPTTIFNNKTIGDDS